MTRSIVIILGGKAAVCANSFTVVDRGGEQLDQPRPRARAFPNKNTSNFTIASSFIQL